MIFEYYLIGGLIAFNVATAIALRKSRKEEKRQREWAEYFMEERRLARAKYDECVRATGIIVRAYFNQ